MFLSAKRAVNDFLLKYVNLVGMYKDGLLDFFIFYVLCLKETCGLLINFMVNQY